MKKLIQKIKRVLVGPTPKIPKCFSDENFLYCWCGKCKQEGYPLPEDFKMVELMVKYLTNEKETS